VLPCHFANEAQEMGSLLKEAQWEPGSGVPIVQSPVSGARQGVLVDCLHGTSVNLPKREKEEIRADKEMKLLRGKGGFTETAQGIQPTCILAGIQPMCVSSKGGRLRKTSWCQDSPQTAVTLSAQENLLPRWHQVGNSL
jgi:hypothetical protein